MNNQNIPPVLYYGTSSLYLAGILNTGINPSDSFGGQLLLTPDINKAVQDATTKSYWDERDSQYKPDPNHRIVPIVCRVLASDLIDSFIATNHGSVANDNLSYVAYNDTIPMTKDRIQVVT